MVKDYYGDNDNKIDDIDDQESKVKFADMTKSQIQDVISFLYPDTENIVKIFNKEQPKFYIDSDDEYDEIEKMEDQIICNEIKKVTNSTRLLNAINSDSESEVEEIGKLKKKKIIEKCFNGNKFINNI